MFYFKKYHLIQKIEREQRKRKFKTKMDAICSDRADLGALAQKSFPKLSCLSYIKTQ
jgi:hypothetical protein